MKSILKKVLNAIYETISSIVTLGIMLLAVLLIVKASRYIDAHILSNKKILKNYINTCNIYI